jgi:hypothetical protein
LKPTEITLDPPCNFNATTPPSMTSPTAPTCSAGSSLASTSKPHDRSDNDYPHNAAEPLAPLAAYYLPLRAANAYVSGSSAARLS